jgi:hypothetical protein
MSNETLVLDSSNVLPDVPLAPAPWQNTGNGYIVAVWLPRDVIDHAFLPPTLAPSHRGRLALMMFVDYHETACGHYHELLYMPGPLQFNEQRHRSITRDFVSTYDAVVNGRRNWGLPMDRADFQVRYDEDGTDHIQVSREGRLIADLRFKAHGPSVFFQADLIPRFLRTFAQHWQGQEFVYTPSAEGFVQGASLQSAQIDPQLFPDITRGKVLAVVKARSFRMRFSPAFVAPIRRRDGG